MKLKRIILLLLTVMFSFSYGEVFAKDGSSLKKALKNKFFDWRVSEHTSKFR